MRSTPHPAPIDPRELAARACLLLCARTHTGGDADLVSLLRQGVDWAHLVDLGRRHSLLPLAYARLRHLDGDLVDPGAMAQLRRSYYATLQQNVRLQASLAKAVDALHGAGLAPIVLKGAALAGTVYANPGLRPMVDLDLLVPTRAMERAGAALAALGYHLSGGLPARMVAFQQHFGGGLEWLRQDDFGVTRIDLQHDLVGVDLCRHAFAIEPDALWAAARPLSLDGGQALQLSPEDTLIHLCLHPALHHGYASRLIGYVDIDRLVTCEGSDAFWGRLVSRAIEVRARGAVACGLHVAQQRLGTPVPAGALAALAPGALQQRLLARLAPLDSERIWVGAESPASGIRQLLLYAALMDRTRDVAGMVRAILFPSAEWLTVRYSLTGAAQVRRQRLIHPLRVARALLRGLRRPLIQSGLD